MWTVSRFPVIIPRKDLSPKKLEEKKWRPKPLRSYEIRGGMTCSIMWCLSGEKFLCSCFLAAYHVRCIKILYKNSSVVIYLLLISTTHPSNWIACQAEEFVGQGCWRVCASLLYSSYFICQLFVVHIYLSFASFSPNASLFFKIHRTTSLPPSTMFWFACELWRRHQP